MKVAVFWFRRDLRLEDNTGLNRALASGYPVLALFIFDQQILDELPAEDARVSFIHKNLGQLDAELRQMEGSLLVRHGNPRKIWDRLIQEHEINAVYTNRDYEPYASERDQAVRALLSERGIPLYDFKDQVIFEKDEIVKEDGDPYTIYTPYKNRWLGEFEAEEHSSESLPPDASFHNAGDPIPSLADMGFKPSSLEVPSYDLSVLERYADLRDIPSADATSRLSPHLRFGTVSIRKIVSRVTPGAEVFLGELIWREFYMQILYHYPDVVTDNFRSKYDKIRWINDESMFKAWCEGRTGYPLVDAGMKQLNRTGWMHNRVRMVAASFLCKHLLIDWRWGEAYFAEKLLDYELSSNNGNWQWAAGTGCDAAPYFRIFNPRTQLERFDKDLAYIKTWIPDYDPETYTEPLVEHKKARSRALKAYGRINE